MKRKTDFKKFGIRSMPLAMVLFLFASLSLITGCSAPKGHFVNSQGQPLLEMDYLWESVNDIFPEALPQRVKLVWVSGPHSSFMIDSNAIGIPAHMKSHIRRGKICRELTHLALHRLSGGDSKIPGRCFDNDIAFLEQAIAGYIDRSTADILDDELDETRAQAAAMFRNGELSLADLRDWESFFYRGFWSDQYTKWNLRGLRVLVTLGDYLERTYGLNKLGPAFELLADDSTLDSAMEETLGVKLETILRAWRDELLEMVPEPVEEETTGPDPATQKDAAPPEMEPAPPEPTPVEDNEPAAVEESTSQKSEKNPQEKKQASGQEKGDG